MNKEQSTKEQREVFNNIISIRVRVSLYIWILSCYRTKQPKRGTVKSHYMIPNMGAKFKPKLYKDATPAGPS